MQEVLSSALSTVMVSKQSNTIDTKLQLDSKLKETAF